LLFQSITKTHIEKMTTPSTHHQLLTADELQNLDAICCAKTLPDPIGSDLMMDVYNVAEEMGWDCENTITKESNVIIIY
jgi:hypothetical protein